MTPESWFEGGYVERKHKVKTGFCQEGKEEEVCYCLDNQVSTIPLSGRNINIKGDR